MTEAEYDALLDDLFYGQVWYMHSESHEDVVKKMRPIMTRAIKAIKELRIKTNGAKDVQS